MSSQSPPKGSGSDVKAPRSNNSAAVSPGEDNNAHKAVTPASDGAPSSNSPREREDEEPLDEDVVRQTTELVVLHTPSDGTSFCMGRAQKEARVSIVPDESADGALQGNMERLLRWTRGTHRREACPIVSVTTGQKGSEVGCTALDVTKAGEWAREYIRRYSSLKNFQKLAPARRNAWTKLINDFNETGWKNFSLMFVVMPEPGAEERR